MNSIIRSLQEAESPILNEFLYEAIYIPEGTEPPPRSIVDVPELQIYVSGFGIQKDDHALAAEADGKIAGVVWARIMDDSRKSIFRNIAKFPIRFCVPN